MFQRIGHIISVLWLALLLLFGTVPKDFIHEFANHKDTEHGYRSGLVLEKVHHHCQFLSLTLDNYSGDYSFPYVQFAPLPEFFLFNAALKVGYIQRCIIATTLRGPPAFNC